MGKNTRTLKSFPSAPGELSRLDSLEALKSLERFYPWIAYENDIRYYSKDLLYFESLKPIATRCVCVSTILHSSLHQHPRQNYLFILDLLKVTALFATLFQRDGQWVRWNRFTYRFCFRCPYYFHRITFSTILCHLSLVSSFSSILFIYYSGREYSGNKMCQCVHKSR